MKQDTNDEIKELRLRLAALQGELASVSFPLQYAVVALFHFEGAEPAELTDLNPRERSGLPMADVKHWPCPEEPCRKIGNMQWSKGHAALGEIPGKAWPWTHTAVRTFPSSAEANNWLLHTPEGKFLKKHAKVVFTSVVYDSPRV